MFCYNPTARLRCGIVLGLALMTKVAQADEAVPEQRRIEPIIDLRLRSESVDQAGMDRDANAMTLRARVGFETKKLHGTSLLAEGEFVWPWEAHYNSTVNGKTSFPVVGDPDTHELNRLQLTNSSLPDTVLTVGRQRINLDDQRFIGSVGWRQNEQTFDALRIVNKSFRHLTVDLTYIDRVNRVFGADSPVGRYRGDTYVANFGYQTPLGILTGFAYLLALDEAPADSSRTFGARFNGNRGAGSVVVGYSAAYATQRDRARNPIDYKDDYYAAELSGALRAFTLTAGFEVLEGDGTKGFATPLATLHRFQGWADKFLTTPPNGVIDRYASAAFSRKSVGALDVLSLTFGYHDYRSQHLSGDFGSEVNLQVQLKWKRFTGLLKYADYRAQEFATDTRKLWAQIEYAL